VLARSHRTVAALLFALVAVVPSAATAVAQDGYQWIWPTTGSITQPFGCTGFYAEPRRGDCAHFHSGIDIANTKGTPIRAVADGVVELVGWDPWIHPNPDWMVIIDHGNGLRTMYAHMRAKPVEGITKGAQVFQGQLIGLMDMTGHATGPHLHFAVYLNGEPVNPRQYLDGPPPSDQGTGTAGPPGCFPIEDANGVGAGLDGLVAMKPVDYSFQTCGA
jgi:murein DD-endopeptidase MepM/ murein hydrolase activator NlpD